MFDESLGVFPILVDMQSGYTSEVTWQWQNHRYSKQISRLQLESLSDQAAEIAVKIRYGRKVHQDIKQIGRALGQAVFSIESADTLLQLLVTRPGAVSLVLINANRRALVDLPWETMILPGTRVPLFAHSAVRGNLEYARLHQGGLESGGRRAALKGLAISANSDGRPLNVKRQVEELSRRFQHHPHIRPRTFVDPQLNEIMLSLSRECALFLFAGHGKFADGTYYIGVNDVQTDIRVLVKDFKRSRVETLIFDSCESSFGGSREGLPSLLKLLPSSTCLLGIQGPGLDSVSCWHMPVVVERLMIGQPIWMTVNAMRLLLYDQDADTWFLPVMHLKPTYVPFTVEEIRNREEYLDLLSRTIRNRRSNV